MIRWCAVKVSRSSSCRAAWKSSAFSSRSANCLSSSAMMVLRAMFGPEMDWEEPSMRNSNLLPVKAMGEVRFRSVLSCGMGGSMSMPTCRVFFPVSWYSFPRMMDCTTPSSSSPRKMERMAGGASWAPSRWSLPALATVVLRVSWYSSTPFTKAARKRRKRAFRAGVDPGLKRFSPPSVPRDQLSCLPLPFTPAKGFSWSRQWKPWRSATFFMSSMVSWFWSPARFALV